MAGGYHRILLLFVDGIGLAEANPDNPFASETAPSLGSLLGGPLTLERIGAGNGFTLSGLDACLGVPGLPQSATGQASLFTGVNASLRMGRHVTGLPGPRLRSVVEGPEGLLRRAREAGCRATFANAYSSEYLRRLREGSARPSVTTCLARSAGLRFRTEDDLDRDLAVTWDITGDRFRGAGQANPVGRRPEDAGACLAALAEAHELTVFETFLPDLAGHGRIEIEAGEVVARLDGLIAGILATRCQSLTVLMTSDHGNFETASVKTHTENPVPLLAAGPAAGRFADLESILDVTPRILDVLAEVAGGASR